VKRPVKRPVKRIAASIAVVLAAAGALVIGALLRRGVSARDQPTRTEIVIARLMRRFATPAAMRRARNPVPLDAASLADGRAHWADHCATCHGNDGSGQTAIGRGLYPKAPDMRQPATQNLSDGELFFIIRNGGRLTGMPAFGDPSGADDADTWKLVHFIRHLPRLTPAELEEMERLNPKTPEEWREMQFLEGDTHP